MFIINAETIYASNNRKSNCLNNVIYLYHKYNIYTCDVRGNRRSSTCSQRSAHVHSQSEFTIFMFASFLAAFAFAVPFLIATKCVVFSVKSWQNSIVIYSNTIKHHKNNTINTNSLLELFPLRTLSRLYMRGFGLAFDEWVSSH